MPAKKPATPKKTESKKATVKKPTVKKVVETIDPVAKEIVSRSNINTLLSAGKTMFQSEKRRVKLDKLNDNQLLLLIDDCLASGRGYDIV